MQPERKPKSCAYCGAVLRRQGVGWDTEHVIGRQFLPKPRPRNFASIVVPSCRACNELHKSDEDYFCAMLCLTDAGLSEPGKRAWKQKRGLAKDRGCRAALARGIEQKSIYTPAGIYLGNHSTQKVEWSRLENVIGKWVRGLYWRAYGSRLDASATIRVAMHPPQLLDSFHHGPPTACPYWPGTFEYWHSQDVMDRTRTRWIFRVWNTYDFAAVTNQPMTSVVIDCLASDEILQTGMVISPELRGGHH